MKKIIISKERFKDFSDIDITNLLKIKEITFFAESDIKNNLTDQEMLNLWYLGDLCVSYNNVLIYDDGAHVSPKIHDQPFNANLHFVPGLLLRNDNKRELLDSDVLDENLNIIIDKFISRFYHKLYPIFKSIDLNDERSIITIPSIGCGQFSGEYHNLQFYLYKAIKYILDIHKFENINAIVFDGFDKVQSDEIIINGTKLISSPVVICDIQQLSLPSIWGYDDCKLNSIVAWDHGSWPGNDFYLHSRFTDDGVKAASSNIMTIITGVDGKYCRSTNRYLPENKQTWYDIAKQSKLVFDNIERY